MKKRVSLIKQSCLLLMAGGLPLAPSAVRADVLAYEGFDYAAGTALGDQGGGIGWAAPWTVIHPNGGSLNVTAGNLTAGANAPAGYDALSGGQSANLISNFRDGRNLDTAPGGAFDTAGYVDGNGRIGADGKRLYFSFLQKSNGAGVFYEFELHRDDLGDPGRIAGIGNDQAGDNINFRAPANVHSFLSAGNTDVNFYVVRIDFKDGNDDIRVYQNPTSATEPEFASLELFDQADMAFTGIALGAFLNGRQVAHDEIRFGETWADMVSAPINPPTPAAITVQPHPTTVYTGGTVELAAVVTGSPPPALQWYRGNTALLGETGAKLTLTNISPAAAGAYRLTATNGSGTATSDIAAVNVLPAPDGLIAYEGFDYPIGTGNLAGQNGGLGWSAPWLQINNGSDDLLEGSLVAGAAAPTGFDTRSLGNQAFLPNQRRDGRALDLTPEGPFAARGLLDGFGNIGADDRTLYFSFLQQPNGTALFYEMEFHRGDLGDGGRIGGIGNDQNGDNVHLRAPNATHTLIGPGSTEVNFYVVRIDYKNGNDDVRVYQNPVSATEPGEPTLTAPDQADMSFSGLSMGAFANGRTVTHDELRIGETWASVAPASASPYTQWLTGFTFPAGADQTPAGDADKDTLTNLQEYAFGTNPTLSTGALIAHTGAAVTAHGSPTLTGTNAADLRGVFGRRKDAAAAGLTYVAEFSADLLTWHAAAAAPTVLASDAVIDAVSVPWPAQVPVAGGSAAPRFFRVRVTMN